MNNFQLLKKMIMQFLVAKNTSVLKKGDIELLVNGFRNQISITGMERIVELFSLSSPFIKNVTDDISNELWEVMINELHEEFNVESENGISIQGDRQRKRIKWWSTKSKAIVEDYYWNRYFNLLRGKLPPDVVKTINDDTDVIMDNLADPSTIEGNTYGMVVGHVQSGKTGNYSSLICKAADAGYKVIIVIAGDKNNLRNQTQERLMEAFVGEESGHRVGVGIDSSDKMFSTRKPLCYTTSTSDFKKGYVDQNKNLGSVGQSLQPCLFVIKKNKNVLESVLDLFGENKLSVPMLLIDDESDYASVNTGDENKPKAINGLIRKLMYKFDNSTYVAYTATPFANIFIDHKTNIEEYGEDLFPSDFIFAIKPPSTYFGAAKIFLETDFEHIETIEDYSDAFPETHKKDKTIKDIPNSLNEAMRLFLINIAIRDLRGYQDSHNSMMIHISRFTNIHKQTSLLVEDYLRECSREIWANGKKNKPEIKSLIINEFKTTFEKYIIDEKVSFKKVISYLPDVVKTVNCYEVHQSSTRRLEYSGDTRINAIVIGGLSISRGYTIEGLSISYFIRNSIFYDTLFQMGRWFGYRSGYESLCKIFMPEQVRSNFVDIIGATNDLFARFNLMKLENKTPEEFGLYVRYNPDSALQVTARNKLKNADDLYLEMCLDGEMKETSRVVYEPELNKLNNELVLNMYESLENQYPKIEKGNKGETAFFTGISRNIVRDFLNSKNGFNFYLDEHAGLSARMPLSFILDYINDIELCWDIVFVSGDEDNEYVKTSTGKGIHCSQRRIGRENPEFIEVSKRKISSGTPEKLVFDSKEISEIENKYKELNENKSEEITKALLYRRAMKRPALFIYGIQFYHPKEKGGVDVVYEKNLCVPGLSFCFPVDSGSKSVPYRVKANTVVRQELEKALAELKNDRDEDNEV